MKIKNYLNSFVLIISMVVGCIIGLVFKDKALVLKPLATLFLNLLYVVIPPLIFLTISTSIGKNRQKNRLSKLTLWMITVFIMTSLVAVFIGLICSYNVNFITDGNVLELENDVENVIIEDINFLQKSVDVLSVDDFVKLFSKDNVIALVIISILTGISINLTKSKSLALLKVLDSSKEVVLQFMKLIMYYAPIGICAYFATIIVEFDGVLTIYYIKLFFMYILATLIMYFIIYSIYAYLSRGKLGFRSFWVNIIPLTLTSLATCSSSASIAINIDTTKKIGVSEDVCNTLIPLGTNFHKDGSIIGSVFKIMFLVSMFNLDISLFNIIVISLVATLLVVGVPIGGGSISEMLILSLLGLPIVVLPLLTMIATIIDAPATLLNVVGDSASCMIVDRLVEEKHQDKRFYI